MSTSRKKLSNPTMSVRRFLNSDKEMTGFIALTVPKAEAYERYGIISPTFCISDCSRKINLDFYASSKEEITQGRKKAKHLKESFDKFFDAYFKALDELEKYNASLKNKSTNKKRR